MIKEDARVIGGQDRLLIGEGTIIHEGTWHKAPHSISILEIGFSVTECIGDKVVINCTCTSVERWLGGVGERYGRMLGLDRHELDLLIEAVRKVKGIKQ